MAVTSEPALSVPIPDGWSCSRRLHLLDFDVAVWSDEIAVVELVDELFAPTAGSGAAAHALFVGHHRREPSAQFFAALDGNILLRSPARSIAFAHAMFEANQQAIERSNGFIRVHAAAAVVEGCAVLLPGPMGTGKSTLVAGLVAAGSAYLSDEVGALDRADGRIHPYAKPISLGSPPDSLPVRWEPHADVRSHLGSTGLVPATALGGPIGTASRLALIVLPRYEAGAPTRIERLSRSDALAEVAAHTFHLDEPGSLESLADLIDGIDSYRLVSGSLPEAVDVVRDLATRAVVVE